ncbi:hypothetical protein ACEPPN_012741 [Leptodophora sp. 'Broadleaf-Isolate-01']
MDILTALKQCITGTDSNSNALASTSTSNLTPNPEIKLPLQPTSPTPSELTTALLHTLLTSEKKSLYSLRTHLSTQIGAENWSTSLAQHLLDGLIHALNTSAAMGSTMKEAFDRASGVAEEFAREHPVLVGVMVTLVALGILALVMPWVIEALGFGALGPVEGSFAALWQATFPDVTAGSWFAFFQRLGMVWGKSVVVWSKL